MVRPDGKSRGARAQALLDHVRRVQPAFPDSRERDADLAGHLMLRARLDRAAHAFARR